MHSEKPDIQSVLAAIGREEAPSALRERIAIACSEAEPIAEIGCYECLQHASAYLDDELPVSERDAFEAHVFMCASCYAAFKRMERTAEVLRETPAAAAPAGLHQRIIAAIGRESRVEPHPAFTWRRAAAVLGGLAAAAALLAAVFVPNGNDGAPSSAPVIAEAPAEVATTSEEPVVAAPAEPDQTTMVADAAVTAPERPATRVSPRTAAETRVGSVPTAFAPEPAPERVAPAPERVTPTPQPAAVERTTTPSPGRTTPTPRAIERPVPAPVDATPTPAPVTEPTIAEERPTPAPVGGRTPVSTPPAPAHESAPRETAIAAIPTAPQPVSAAPVAAAPAVAERAPAPGNDRDAVRLAVVPRQPRSRTVFRSEDAPASDRLSRMTSSINGSVNSRLDNPTSGIELN